MKILIISGGNINQDFALDFLRKNEYEKVVVADKGIEFCYENHILPQLIVGDFDSAKAEIVSYYQQKEIPIVRLQPEKDDTDTQSAIREVLKFGIQEIDILGATGTRVDHMFANIQVLAWGLEHQVMIHLYDANNYISLHKNGFTLKRAEQFGKYVSFFTLGDEVRDLTLKGFKYPLTNHLMKNTDAGLGVSNEIVQEECQVSFSKGTLLMIQSKD